MTVDKNGNQLTRIGNYWMSNNFDRFWELLCANPDEVVIMVSKSSGKIYSRPKKEISRFRKWAEHRFRKYDWYFLDPATQTAYEMK